MNKIKELLDTKKKKLIAIVMIVGVVIISGVGIYALNQPPKTLLKAVKEVTVEYGEAIPTETKDYIDTKGLSKEDKAKVLKNTKVAIEDLKNEDGKEYPPLGEYKTTLTFEDEKITTKITVKDTIAPVLNSINEVSILQGNTEFNYADYIKAEDLQELSYAFITDTIDVNTVGEYTMQVIVTDKSGNEVNKDVKIIVIEKPTEEADVEVITDPETGKVTTKVTVKEPTTNADTSSNNTTNNNNSNATTNNNTSNNNNNSSGNDTGGTTPPTPHVHRDGSNVVKWFSTRAEANAFGENYLINQTTWEYNRYGVTQCSCGMYGVEFMK